MGKLASLKDLEKELWLRQRFKDNIVWVTKEGKEVPINSMSDSNLINTINMLRRKEEEQKEIDFIYFDYIEENNIWDLG